MSAAGVVTALKLEARTLRWRTRRPDGLFATRDGTLVAVSGMGCAAAASGARKLVEAGVTALVSWGMAGGLDPALRAGTICLPQAVLATDGTAFTTDVHRRGILAAAIGARLTVVGGKLLTSNRAIDHPAAKAAAFHSTGAAVVDMESVAVASVAAAHELPFVAVRVVVDTALDSLPASVLAAGAGGELRMARLVLGLLRAPRDLPAVLRLAQRYRDARQALAAVARTGALAPLALALAGAAGRVA